MSSVSSLLGRTPDSYFYDSQPFESNKMLCPQAYLGSIVYMLLWLKFEGSQNSTFCMQSGKYQATDLKILDVCRNIDK